MKSDPQYIAFYGTLMQDQHTAIRNVLQSQLIKIGGCLIPGTIYDLGRYPGLKLDGVRHSVHGELYEIDSPEPLAVLDEYEAHDNYDISLPGFSRRLIQLESPQQLAWVYEYDGPVDAAKIIESEDWAKR